jgi:long-chain acyl-CoA synthetase
MRKASLKNVTIIELLVAINRRFSNIPAVQAKRGDGFYSISYIDLGRRTSDTAYTLKTLGVERGDRVAILSESRPEWSVAFFGIVTCAGITVPMDAKLSDAEIEFILNDSEAKCLFTSSHYIERIQNLRPKLRSLKQIILFDEVPGEGLMFLKDCKVPENEIAHREITPEDIALTVYTSGTTGVAKGVQLTYRNLLFEVMSLNDYVEFKPGDQFLSILPLNHMLELTGGLIAPLYTGATITYCDSIKPTNIIKLMQETKTTVMICVPLVLKMFYDGIIKKAEGLPGAQKKLFFGLMGFSKFLLKLNIRAGKLFFGKVHAQFGGHLRCFVSGGAPLDPLVEENFTAMGFNVLQGYGLTETSPVITVNTFKERKYGSVGIPLKGLEVKIVPANDTGRQEGEIITRGPQVMLGYYRNPEKTAEVIKDGWFYTGDIGYFDDDGFLFISGRIRNLIVLGAGKKVFPEEVEEVMSASPFIKEICVLGRVAQKGARKGCEEVYAVAVPNLDSFEKEQRQDKGLVRKKISEELSRLGGNLSEYKRIMDFDVWYDELPKTSTRKVKRKVLLEMIANKDKEEGGEKKEFVETAASGVDELSVRVKQVVADLVKVKPEQVNSDANLYTDLGVDSLMKVELFSALEKQFGARIPDEVAYEIRSLSDVVRFLKESKAGKVEVEAVKDEDVDRLIRETPFLKMSRTFTYFFLRTVIKIYCKFTARGLENIPEKGSFIIGANHSSLLDFPLIFCSLSYKRTREVIAPAAHDFFYARPLRRMLVEVGFNTFPFERMGNFMKGLKTCARLIEKGKSIILFPEGSRSTSPGVMGKFKPGIGSLAFDLNIPLVPCYIEGAYEVLPKGGVVPRPHKVKVIFGKPMYLDRYKELAVSMSRYQIYERIAEDLRNEIEKLSEADG